jgi:hypothetical protein
VKSASQANTDVVETEPYRTGYGRLGVLLLLMTLVGLPVWLMMFPFFALGGTFGVVLWVLPPMIMIAGTLILLWHGRKSVAVHNEKIHAKN